MNINIKRKKWVSWRLLLSGLLTLYLAGDSFIGNYLSERKYKVLILIFLGLLLIISFFMIVNGIKQLLKKEPALVLSDEGITDNITLAKLGFIDWDKIKSCEIKDIQRAPHLVVVLQNYYGHADEVSQRKRSIADLFEKKYGTPFVINSKLISFELQDLKAAIESKIEFPDDSLEISSDLTS